MAHIVHLPQTPPIHKWGVIRPDPFPKSSTALPSGPGFDGVGTFAEQIKHVACGNFPFFNEIEHKTPPEHCEKGGPARAATKSELIQYLRDSFDYGNKVLAAMTDTSAREMVQGQYFGNNTGLR